MFKKALFVGLVGLALPGLALAAEWSACQTITGVSNYLAHSNDIRIALSPGAAGCANDSAGGVGFRVGQNGVTSDSIKAYLATALAAQLSGKRVMIYYDSSTSACFSSIISVGGFAGQCP